MWQSKAGDKTVLISKQQFHLLNPRRGGMLTHCATDQNEPHSRETYLRTCAPSEDSDQTAHSRSVIRIFPRRIFDSQECSFVMRTKKTEHTARMRGLSWVFVGRTYSKVCFLTLRLKWFKHFIYLMLKVLRKRKRDLREYANSESLNHPTHPIVIIGYGI